MRYVTKLSPTVLAVLERKFPPPVVTSGSTAMEVAAQLAYQRVFRELREGFMTDV